jgi:hypothetical protein
MENNSRMERVERILFTETPCIKPQLIKKPKVVIPDSIKKQFLGYSGRSIYEIEVGSSGRVLSYKLFSGDTLFNIFISRAFEGYLFKPALNRYGERISSRLMVPIKFNFSNDTSKVGLD